MGVIHIHSIAVDDMPLGCADTQRIQGWIYDMAWSNRRMFAAYVDEFLFAWLEHMGVNPDQARVFIEEADQEYVTSAAKVLETTVFYADYEEPPAEAEAGELVEFTNIRVAPPKSVVMAKLGITDGR